MTEGISSTDRVQVICLITIDAQSVKPCANLLTLPGRRCLIMIPIKTHTNSMLKLSLPLARSS